MNKNKDNQSPVIDARPCEAPKRCNVRIIIIIHACVDAFKKVSEGIIDSLNEWGALA